MAKFGGVSGDQVRSIIERVERLEEEKANIAADIREVFAEAKGNGHCTKTIRTIIKLRKLEGSEREEQEYLLDTYMRALGMLPSLDEEDEAEPGLPGVGHNKSASGRDTLTDSDELYEKAVEYVREYERATASGVQRHLGIGYNRAARMIERMEQEGVISPADVSGRRMVYPEKQGEAA